MLKNMTHLRKRDVIVEESKEEEEEDEGIYDDDYFGKALGNTIDTSKTYKYTIFLKIVICILTILAFLSSDVPFSSSWGWMIMVPLILFKDEIVNAMATYI